MILAGCVVHMLGYVIKLFRIRICVCGRSNGLWEESEECDAGKCTSSACKIKNN
jgi:hypothetical protein